MTKVQTPYDELTYQLTGLAMAVHRELGPGLPETFYHAAMTFLMADEGVFFENEFPVHVTFRGRSLGSFKLDLVAERQVVVELKAVAELTTLHQQQVIAYLAASGLSVGLLLNFGGASLEHHRIFPPKAVQASAAYQARKSLTTP